MKGNMTLELRGSFSISRRISETGVATLLVSVSSNVNPMRFASSWRTELFESGESLMSEVCDLKAHLQSITEKNRGFYSDPRGIGALKDLQQTFPNPWLYVAELLQNAVDEHATRIRA